MTQQLQTSRLLRVALGAAVFAFGASGQTVIPGSTDDLANVLPVKVGSQLRLRSTDPAGAEINSDVTSGLLNTTTALASGIANQFLLLPIVSPASGFVYGEDAATGMPTKRRRSLGPIFAERAETIGRRRFFMGFAFQRFDFDRLGVRTNSFNNVVSNIIAGRPEETGAGRISLKMNALPFIFQRQYATGGPKGDCVCGDPAQGWNEQGLIQAPTDVTLVTSRSTAFFTYGLTDWFDASLVLPLVSTTLRARTQGQLLNIPPPNVSFESGTAAVGFGEGSNTGLGDITLRFKASLLGNRSTGLAVGTDVRLPTGDEFNLRGAGAAGVRPFVVLSRSFGPVTPHANFGYQFNGKSILAGNFVRKEDLPNVMDMAFGADVDIKRRVTFAVDVLSQRLYETNSMFYMPDLPIGRGANTTNPKYQYLAFYNLFPPNGDPTVAPRRFVEDITVWNGSAGFKTVIAGNLLATVNVLFKLNNAGLRARVVPTLGVSYVF